MSNASAFFHNKHPNISSRSDTWQKRLTVLQNLYLPHAVVIMAQDQPTSEKKGMRLMKGAIGWKQPTIVTVFPFYTYCWWKKSCTTWDAWNPVKNEIFTISTDAGFLPSTVSGHCLSGKSRRLTKVHFCCEPLGLKQKRGFWRHFFWTLDVKAAIMGTLVGTHAMTHPPHDFRVVVHAEETQNRS